MSVPASAKKLFSEHQLGPHRLKNRLVMAPMTRSRAGAGNVPTLLMSTYYGQRATAGLIITEATQVAPEGQGYMNTPGIHSPEQVQGWKGVTKAVHEAGGKIFLQLWHVGRISHSSYQPNRQLPVSASAVAAAGKHHTPDGFLPFETPRALELAEISSIVDQFRSGAENAVEAGFDGVEVHGANGYLLDQFLQSGTNQRADAYGGSVQNRARLLLEVTKAVVEVWSKERVGVRLSPNGSFNDMSDANPRETFSHAVSELDRLGIAYLHMREGTASDVKTGRTAVPLSEFRPHFHKSIIINDGYDKDRAEAVLESGLAELVAFGVPFLANPDLPARYAAGAPLNKPDMKTFYGGAEKGYTDYPALER